MFVNEFIKIGGKKLFLSNSISEVNAVLKNYCIKNKTTISDIEIFALTDIAKSLLLSFKKDIQFINNDEANIIFYTFLSSHKEPLIYGLIPQESMAMSTSKMVYSTINEVRMGKKLKPTKLDKLINDFEQFLINNNCYDEPLLKNKCLTLLNEKSPNEIRNALALDEQISIGVFATLNEKLRYLDAQIIKGLEKAYNTTASIIEFRNENIECPITKVTTYGYMNEVRFVLDQINKDKLKLNDVGLYVTDNKYNNLLKAVFENSDIPYAFESGDDAETNEYISLFKCILNFLFNHLNITALYEIYKNKALKESYKNIAELRKLRSNKHAIIETIQRSKQSSWNDEQKEFLLSLVEIYQSDKKISDIYHLLIELINKYSHEEMQNPGKQLIVSKERFICFMDELDLSFNEKIKFILDVLKGLKIVSPTNENACVEIRSLNNASFLDKKYNFVIGLSAKQFEIKEIQSPLFSDDEFIEHLDTNYFIEISNGKNARHINKVINLFKTLNDGYIYLIRSKYDSSELKELAPAIILNLFKNEIDPLNHYLDITSKVESKNLLRHEILNEETSKTIIDKKYMSPSSLEKLLNCPLDYIYSKTCEQIELDEYTGSWLKGGDFGTFAHKILEEYFKLPSTSSSFNEPYLKESFDLALSGFVSEVPFDDQSKINSEANQVLRVVKTYLKRYYKERNSGEPYQVIGREVHFSNIVLHDIGFAGQVDRIDAFVDANKVLHLRIIDYKTTSKKKFEEKEKEGLVTQSVIYPIAALNYVKNNVNVIKDIVGNFDSVDEQNILFVYELLKLNKKSIYELAKQQEIKLCIENGLDKFNLFISDPTVDNFLNVYEPQAVKAAENDSTRCKYCAFKAICHFKFHFGEDKGWKK